MMAKSLVAGVVGLALSFSAATGMVFTSLPDLPLSMTVAGHGTTAAEPVHYRAHKYGYEKHRRADEPFILRQPDYGMLPYIYDRRASYPYRCVPATAAQFFYCRERFLTFDPVIGAWVSYAPYGHLCSCR